MDVLAVFKKAYSEGSIPKGVYDLTLKRFPITVDGINRIQKASGIDYPLAYVEPTIFLAPDPNFYGQAGLLHARTIPILFDGKMKIVIQISASLIAYGLKGTIHAILAHEFLHYLELIITAKKGKLISDELSGNLFENMYADETRLFEPRAVFKDRTLLNHITKKFPSGFRDKKLEDKIRKFWIDKNLPAQTVTLDSNHSNVSAESLSNIELDPKFILKITELEKRSAKIRKKILY